MSTSFDNEDEDDFPALPPTIPTRFSFGDANARASSSRLPERGSSIASESRSFLSRLEASVSPNGKSERRSILEEESKLGDEDGVLGLEEEGDEGELDEVRRMGRVWVRERGTVEVMRWEGDLVDSLMDKLEQQVGALILDSSLSRRRSAPLAAMLGLCFEL